MNKIENIRDLRSELSRLRIQREQYENDFQEIADKIEDRVKAPMKIINKITDFFDSFFGTNKGNNDADDGNEWLMRLFGVGVPVFLNRFIFRKAGFITKSLVALISQKAATNIGMDTVSGIIEKVSNWIKGAKTKTRRKPVLPDYGIPPDSETF